MARLPYAVRIYQCVDCDQLARVGTNHNGECYPQCTGRCRQIINPNTAREVVLRKSTAHRYVSEIDGTEIPQ